MRAGHFAADGHYYLSKAVKIFIFCLKVDTRSAKNSAVCSLKSIQFNCRFRNVEFRDNQMGTRFQAVTVAPL